MSATACLSGQSTPAVPAQPPHLGASSPERCADRYISPLREEFKFLIQGAQLGVSLRNVALSEGGPARVSGPGHPPLPGLVPSARLKPGQFHKM